MCVYRYLLVLFDSDLALLREQNGYVIDSQGKAPDFVLEVASPTTGRGRLYGQACRLRALRRCGILALFDPSDGEYHDAALAGDRLVNRVYEAIEIKEPG